MSATSTRERPILFSGPMVRAILEGRKTQTRRVIKNPEKLEGLMQDGEAAEWCPYGKLGDHLWVREAFGTVDDATHQAWLTADPGGADDYECNPCAKDGPNGERWIVDYRADNPQRPMDKPHPKTGKVSRRWRPSIHMPRWASRITLEITDVRVERVQEISENDAVAEGIQKRGRYWDGGPHPVKGGPKCFPLPRAAFKDLWDSINAKRGYGWHTNPWVWVIEFRRAVWVRHVEVKPEAESGMR
ncbi:MAG: hypothetical protein GY906_38975 [bacterium]|nr:hypothetical protein [bacterium]